MMAALLAVCLTCSCQDTGISGKGSAGGGAAAGDDAGDGRAAAAAAAAGR
jgi:hypothetical protein